jgi:hypothetical protein
MIQHIPKGTLMQGNSRLVAAILAAVVVSAPAMSPAAHAQTAGDRFRLYMGPYQKPVNEPQISQMPVNLSQTGVAYFVIAWQTGHIPSGSATEAPRNVEYIVSEYDISADTFDWNVPDLKTFPMMMVTESARDPAVVVTDDPASNTRFVGATELLFGSDQDILAARAYNALYFNTVPGGSPDPDRDLARFTNPNARYPRLGIRRFPTAADRVFLLAHNIDPNAGAIQQIMLTISNLGVGEDWDEEWTAWQFLEHENETPIIGFPSPMILGLTDTGAAVAFMFSYMDINATYLAASLRRENETEEFEAMDVDIDPNLDVPTGETYFTRSNDALAGDFGLGPFTTMLASTTNKYAYIVYHDFAGDDDQLDEDFDVFVVRGHFDHSQEMWIWGDPYRVNQDESSLGVRSDQFMPAAVLDGTTLHIAYYDTRDDLREPDDDVKIGLTYATVTDTNGVLETTVELLLDTEAIDTSYLLNPKSIGDRIDITQTPDGARAVIAYMGTEHPRVGQQTPEQDDEAIYVQIIELDEEE